MRIVWLLLVLVVGSEAAGTSITQLQTGVLLAINSANIVATNKEFTVNFVFPSALNPFSPIGFTSAGLGLINFQGIVSSSFSFNSSIDTFNKTQITIVTVTLSDTYWSLLAFHYIVADYVRLEIQNGCFFTPQLQSGTGTRTQTFDNVLLSNFTGGPDIRVVTVIRGLSLSNPNGASHQVSVSSTLPLSKSYLVNTITAYEQNLLKWVCLTVLVVKENVLPKQYTYYNSQSLTDTTNMTTVFNFYPSVKASQYAFFGLSTLNIGFLGDTTWQLLLNTGDTTQVSLNATLSSNINEVVVEAVIFVFLDCFANYFKPETYSCVTSCATNFYYNTLRICTVCNPICLTCNSTATTCLTCNTTYHRSLTSNNCTCATGYYDTGVLNCSSCTKIFNCLVCSSATHCTGCSGVFIPNTAGKACVCPTGKFLVGNICSQLAGCITVIHAVNAVYCRECNQTLGFTLNLAQLCECTTGLILNGSTCDNPCGNGNPQGKACDDGNAINNDGCSNCTVDTGYSCSSKTVTSPSLCVHAYKFSFKLLSTMRALGQNEVVMVFQISPSAPELAQMNFSTYIATSFANGGVTATYDPDTAQLTTAVLYTQPIQNSNSTIDFSFNNTLLSASPVSLPIITVGSNFPLTLDTYANISDIIGLLALLVGIIVLVLALGTSLYGRKLMGFELILPVQCTYFGLSCLSGVTATIGQLKNLYYSTGYNTIPKASLNENSNYAGLSVIGFQNEFLLNFNFMGAVLVFGCLLVYICNEILTQLQSYWSQGRQFKKDELDDPTKYIENKKADTAVGQRQSTCRDRVELVFKVLLDRFVIFLLVATMTRIIFSFNVQMLAGSTGTTNFSHEYNLAASVFFTMFTCGGIIYIYKQSGKQNGIINFQSQSQNYPILLIGFYFYWVAVLSELFYTSFGIYILAATSVLPLIFFLCCKPYDDILSVDSIIAIICHISFIFSMLCIVSFKVIKPLNELIAMSLTVIINALYIAASLIIVFNLVRQLKCLKKLSEVKEKKKRNKQTDQLEKEKEMEALACKSIKEHLLTLKNPDCVLDAHLKNDGLNSPKRIQEKRQMKASLDNSFNNKESENESDNSEPEVVDDELTRLKKRLREELVSHRQRRL